jgi:hypothetical protein
MHGSSPLTLLFGHQVHAGQKDRLSVSELVDLQINSILHVRSRPNQYTKVNVNKTPTASVAAMQKHEDTIGCELFHAAFNA